MTPASRPVRVIGTAFAVALLAGCAIRAARTTPAGASPVASPSSPGPTDPASPPPPSGGPSPWPTPRHAELAWLTGVIMVHRAMADQPKVLTVETTGQLPSRLADCGRRLDALGPVPPRLLPVRDLARGACTWYATESRDLQAAARFGTVLPGSAADAAQRQALAAAAQAGATADIEFTRVETSVVKILGIVPAPPSP